MESFFSRYKSGLVLLAVLLAQVIGLASQMRRADYASRADGHHVRLIRAWAAYTITPIENLLRGTGSGVRRVWSGYIDLRHVRQHDKDLQYQIDQLRLRESALAEDARQGQRLQRMLGFKQQYVGKTVAAQVTGTGGGDASRILVIDKGSDDGLKTDMAVITPDGIVGKVRDVFAHSSQVLLLNDVSSGAGVVLVNTRSRGILRGMASGEAQINNLLPDERIKVGEQIVTSGGDRVFPRGLRVGTVKSVRPDPDHQPYAAIVVKTAANLDRLEEVLVVTDVAEQLASTATTGAGADDNEEGKRAAEVVADKLPSLTDPAAKPGDVKADPTAPAPIPKPKPAIRTDRYSPGAAPPATSLQPGGSNSTTNAPEAPNAP
jgi:rod shape-determining protein MreC